MSLAIALLLSIQNLSGWTVNDTTDNDTGKRSISALTLNDVTEKDTVLLHLRCREESGPALSLNWIGLESDDWEVVLLDSDKSAGFHALTFFEDDDRSELVMMGDEDAILSGVDDSATVTLTTYSLGRERVAKFGMKGLKAAWTRVKSVCPFVAWDH